MSHAEFQRIIPATRSVMVAADVEDEEELRALVKAVQPVEGILSFKLGFTLGYDGLEWMCDIIRDILYPRVPVLVFDHQKAGNDIPDMGSKFAAKLKECGIDAGIIFPFAGPATQEAWTKAMLGAGLQVLTGGIMTHPQFLHSEGGYIADDAPERIYALAHKLGVRHFVVPGNKPDWVKRIRVQLEGLVGQGNFVLYAPGFITQGGDITECGQLAGKNFHAIVGSGIYKHQSLDKMRAAAVECAKIYMS